MLTRILSLCALLALTTHHAYGMHKLKNLSLIKKTFTCSFSQSFKNSKKFHSTDFKDFFKDLNKEEIKEKYIEAAKKYHPDTSKDPNAKELFQSLDDNYKKALINLENKEYYFLKELNDLSNYYASGMNKKNELEISIINAAMFYDNDEQTSLEKLKTLMDKINNKNRLKTILSEPYYLSSQMDTPLMSASWRGYNNIVKLLLEYTKETINYENKNGITALMAAGSGCNSHVVEELLKHGADINHQDKYGWTALMYTCKRGYFLMAKFYIENGANVFLEDNNKKTALDHALNIKELIELLKNASEKINL